MNRGHSEEVTNILLSSCAVSTQKQYKVYVNKWVEFCSKNKINENVSINHVLEFLLSLFKEGLGYSSINSARSSLSLIINSIEGYPVGNHPSIIRFLKGVYN